MGLVPMRQLEIVANVATVAIAIAVGTLLLYRLAVRDVTSLAEMPTAYEIGTALPHADALGVQKAERTLVIAVQQGCAFCQASMPFHRQIIAERNRRRANVRIMMVAPLRDKNIRESLATDEVYPDDVMLLGPNLPLKIAATPTIIIVDSVGTVVTSRAGKLDKQGELAMHDILFGGPSL